MKELELKCERMSWLFIGRKRKVRVRKKNVNPTAEIAEQRHGGLKISCRFSQSIGWGMITLVEESGVLEGYGSLLFFYRL